MRLIIIVKPAAAAHQALSTIARQHDTALRTVVADLSTTARRLKQVARFLNGDFTSST